jgi:chemotaxis protein histidine kinase CheA
MRLLFAAIWTLLTSICLAMGAAAAPMAPGYGASAAQSALILVQECNDCVYDDGGGYEQPQYEQPPPKKKSKWEKAGEIIDQLNRAAEKAAAQKRERDRQKAAERERRRQKKAAERERRKREKAAKRERQKRKAAAERRRKKKAAAAEKKRKARAAAKAERDRKKRAAGAEKKRKQREAAAEKDRKKRAAEQAERDLKNRESDELDTVDRGPVCDGKSCGAGEALDGDCRCTAVSDNTPPPGNTTINGKTYDVILDPEGPLPPVHDIPDTECLLKIGNTSLFCNDYLPDLPPTNTTCRGRTERGCYLKSVKVTDSEGVRTPACMEFCTTKPPPVIAETPKPEKPKVAKPKTPAGKKPGTPAVKTATANPVKEPKRPATPAVKTSIATPYVEPKSRATPAVKTALATTYLEPKRPLTPAVKTAVAATVKH